MGQPAMIVLKNIALRYGRQQVLKGLSLEVPAGQSLALVGPNGAGKSSLLKVLTGLLRAHQGSVSIDGLPVSQLQARRKLAFSPQQLDLPAGLLVKDVLKYVLSLYPQSSSQTRAEMIERFGLAALLHKKADQLSGGENKRVSLTLALAACSEVLILDEPASALDSQYQHALFETVRALRGQRTLVFVSHNYQEIMHNADRLVRLEAGQIVADQQVRAEDADLAMLRFAAPVSPVLPGVLQQRGVAPFWEFQVKDGDAAVRALLAQEVPFSQLEVSRIGNLRSS